MKHAFRFIVLAVVLTSAASAHNSYTGGYSGAPGTTFCSACHGGTSGTLQSTGFPTAYTPGQTYTVTITHNGGNKIVNANATTRLGTTATVAGTFTGGTKTAVYTGADGGIYVTPHLVDTLTFQWKAPASGSGPVMFYASGFQAASTSSTSGGQSSKVLATATEITTGVKAGAGAPREFTLLQNYPNPFNPETNISFTVPDNGRATLKVFNVLGNEVATLFNGMAQAGQRIDATFKAAALPSGIYFSRLEFQGRSLVQKMILTK